MAAAPTAATLPAKSEFPVVNSEVCLNNARWHPASTGSVKAIQQSFARQNAGALVPKLKRASIDIALYDHRIRISPSVYNDQSDIDKLLETLSG